MPDTPAPVAHTPGELDLVFDLHSTYRQGGRTYAYIRRANDIVPVGAIVLGVEGMPETGRDIGRLMVAGALSYDKHCADPIAAAEGDLLGDCLDLLKRVSQGASHTKVFLSSREKMHPAGIDLFDEEMSEARAILSRAGKLKGADHES